MDADQRPRGILTPSDREYLRLSDEEREAEYSRQARSAARSRIRARVRNGLRDFQLLARHLPEDEREELFGTDLGTPERREVEGDVASAVQFMYAGLGGVTGFSRPLKLGVANGELAIGNVQNALQVAVRLEVGQKTDVDLPTAVDAVEEEEYNDLRPADLLAVVQRATRSGAIDFDTLRRSVRHERWANEYVLGKRHKELQGGGTTPLMAPEVFDQWGIGEMSSDELREMFSEEALEVHTVFDGEKVFKPPQAGEEGEPEIVEWIDDPPAE